jgi:hypothetical protein
MGTPLKAVDMERLNARASLALKLDGNKARRSAVGTNNRPFTNLRGRIWTMEISVDSEVLSKPKACLKAVPPYQILIDSHGHNRSTQY